jgi:type VI secretion system secreted protein Hcp
MGRAVNDHFKEGQPLAIYMKVPFTEGSVTTAGYQGWIQLSSLQLDTDRSLSAEVATLANRAHGVPRFSLFNISKLVDESSPGLAGEAWHGSTGHDIEIAVVEPGIEKPVESVRYKLSKAMLSSYSFSSSGDRPNENFAFTYALIEIKFTPHDNAGRAGTTGRVSYDLTINEKV